MQANRPLKRNHSHIASSDSEADDSNAGDHTCTSLVNNAGNDNAVDTAEDKVNFHLKRILLMF